MDQYQLIELQNFSQRESQNGIQELLRSVFNIECIAYPNTPAKDDSIEVQQKNSISYLSFSQIKEQLADYPHLFFFSFLQFKTSGNPLTILDLIDSFLSSKILLLVNINCTLEELATKGNQINNFNIRKTAFITDELKHAMLTEELLTINAPLIKRKIYGPILDQLKTEELLLMKISSVIGTVFDLNTLNSVQPFKELLKQDQLVDVLKNLVDIQFLEILEHTSTNIYFRSVHPFIREVLYQRMDYSQRRQLHLNVAETMQTTVSLEKNEIQEQRRLIYHWKLGENTRMQVQKDNQQDIYLKSKRAIIVKRVTNILKQNTNSSDRTCILHSGIISKQSDKGVSWSPRYVILTVYDLRYYHNLAEYEDSPSECLASIMLKDIIRFDKIQELNGKTTFSLLSEKWFKKDQLKQSQRRFNFQSHLEGIYDEWQIYIEYAKTIQQFNYFTKTYGKITLPFEIPQTNVSQHLFRWNDNDRRAKNSGIVSRDQSISVRVPMNNVSMSIQRQTLNKSKLNISSSSKKLLKDEDSNSSIGSSNSQDQQNINKERVKTFIYKGIMLFMSHIAEMSILADERYKKLGQSTQFMTQNPKLFKIDPVGLQLPQQTNQKSSDILDRSQRQSNNYRQQNSGYEENNSREEAQTSVSSDRSGQKKSISRHSIKEILSEIKEEEEDIQNRIGESSHIKSGMLQSGAQSVVPSTGFVEEQNIEKPIINSDNSIQNNLLIPFQIVTQPVLNGQQQQQVLNEETNNQPKQQLQVIGQLNGSQQQTKKIGSYLNDSDSQQIEDTTYRTSNNVLDQISLDSKTSQSLLQHNISLMTNTATANKLNNQINLTNSLSDITKEVSPNSNKIREENSNTNSINEEEQGEEPPRMHLPTVKELDSFDSSILSNQMKRTQFVQTPVDKILQAQNFISLENKEIHLLNGIDERPTFQGKVVQEGCKQIGKNQSQINRNCDELNQQSKSETSTRTQDKETNCYQEQQQTLLVQLDKNQNQVTPSNKEQNEDTFLINKLQQQGVQQQQEPQQQQLEQQQSLNSHFKEQSQQLPLFQQQTQLQSPFPQSQQSPSVIKPSQQQQSQINEQQQPTTVNPSFNLANKLISLQQQQYIIHQKRQSQARASPLGRTSILTNGGGGRSSITCEGQSESSPPQGSGGGNPQGIDIHGSSLLSFPSLLNSTNVLHYNIESSNCLTSPLAITTKKVRPSQWNNLPFFNLEHCESNTNIQDISVIQKITSNNGDRDQDTPRKEDITKSEQLIYQAILPPIKPSNILVTKQQLSSQQQQAGSSSSFGSSPGASKSADSPRKQSAFTINPSNNNKLMQDQHKQSEQQFQVYQKQNPEQAQILSSASSLVTPSQQLFQSSQFHQNKKQMELQKDEEMQKYIDMKQLQLQQLLQSENNQIGNTLLQSQVPGENYHQEKQQKKQLLQLQVSDEYNMQQQQNHNKEGPSASEYQLWQQNEILRQQNQTLMQQIMQQQLKQQNQHTQQQKYQQMFFNQHNKQNQQVELEVVPIRQTYSLQSSPVRGESSPSHKRQSSLTAQINTSPLRIKFSQQNFKNDHSSTQSLNLPEENDQGHSHHQKSKLTSDLHYYLHINNINNNTHYYPNLVQQNSHYSFNPSPKGALKDGIQLIQNRKNQRIPSQSELYTAHSPTQSGTPRKTRKCKTPTTFSPQKKEQECFKKALTRGNVSSVFGDKFTLSRGLQVYVTSQFKDKTVEVTYQGLTGRFPIQQFILVRDNSSTNKNRNSKSIVLSPSRNIFKQEANKHNDKIEIQKSPPQVRMLK